MIGGLGVQGLAVWSSKLNAYTACGIRVEGVGLRDRVCCNSTVGSSNLQNTDPGVLGF